MRATSPPTALTVAAAAMPLMVAVLVLQAIPSTAQAARWLRPVPGEVARSFDYSRATPFARGAHRGADLAAAPGTPVRAACAGRVLHAGRVAGRLVVSVLCGGRRVSYLPLASATVRAGAPIRAGTPLGTVASGHAGLHLGVRRDGDPFGYVDPLALIAPRATPPPPPVARTGRPRRAPRPITTPRVPLPRVAVPRPIAARPVTPPGAASPRPRVAAPRLTAPFVARTRAAPSRSRPGVNAPRDVAPWPVWAGLGLLLAGAAGSGTVALRRRARPGTRTRPAFGVAAGGARAPPRR